MSPNPFFSCSNFFASSYDQLFLIKASFCIIRAFFFVPKIKSCIHVYSLYFTVLYYTELYCTEMYCTVVVFVFYTEHAGGCCASRVTRLLLENNSSNCFGVQLFFAQSIKRVFLNSWGFIDECDCNPQSML